MVERTSSMCECRFNFLLLVISVCVCVRERERVSEREIERKRARELEVCLEVLRYKQKMKLKIEIRTICVWRRKKREKEEEKEAVGDALKYHWQHMLSKIFQLFRFKRIIFRSKSNYTFKLPLSVSTLVESYLKYHCHWTLWNHHLKSI